MLLVILQSISSLCNPMPTVQILYHNDSNTFIASDDHNNQVTFKVDREWNEAIPISQSSTVGPMLSLLMACGACSGIDIIMILEKQRQSFNNLRITVSGSRAVDETPALWKEVHVAYHLTGEVSEEKAQKAAALSVDKYCSVAETLRRAGAAITFEVNVSPK